VAGVAPVNVIAAISRGKSGRYEIPSEICQLLHFTWQVAPETLVNQTNRFDSIKMSQIAQRLEQIEKMKIYFYSNLCK
jgi:hypothetical protein